MGLPFPGGLWDPSHPRRCSGSAFPGWGGGSPRRCGSSPPASIGWSPMGAILRKTVLSPLPFGTSEGNNSSVYNQKETLPSWARHAGDPEVGCVLSEGAAHVAQGPPTPKAPVELLAAAPLSLWRLLEGLCVLCEHLLPSNAELVAFHHIFQSQRAKEAGGGPCAPGQRSGRHILFLRRRNSVQEDAEGSELDPGPL